MVKSCIDEEWQVVAEKRFIKGELVHRVAVF